jgi:putative Mg2+ transporter-C (MgtC) family protein
MNDLVQALQPELILRAVVGFVLGAGIGVERERRAKVAGLRTHALVAGGAAMFTIASYSLLVGEGTVRDPARIAAQIVTGIGFLGAGAIIHSGSSVSGLTTAASIWAAAAVGMLAGGGSFALAIVGALLTIMTLRMPRHWLRPPPEPDEDDEDENDQRPAL